MDERIERLRACIRDVPDFPKFGILFKDITPLLADGRAFMSSIELLAERVRPLSPDVVIGIESRGFMFGAPLACALGLGFVPARKAGKLPNATVRVDYDLEYGADAIEVHADAFARGSRVLLVDDVIATGGTARAVCDLVGHMGSSVVGAAFLLEITALSGRTKLGAVPVISLVET